MLEIIYHIFALTLKLNIPICFPNAWYKQATMNAVNEPKIHGKGQACHHLSQSKGNTNAPSHEPNMVK